MDPAPLTLRQLVWMTEAKQIDDWNHTSAILAMLGNIHRDHKKGRAFKPADLHPGIKCTPMNAKPAKVDVSVLKIFLVREGCRPQQCPNVLFNNNAQGFFDFS